MPGIADNVVHGKEIGCVVLVGDQAQFGPKRALDRFGDTRGIAFFSPFPGQPLQRLLRRLARADGLLGIIVFELVERKADAGNKGLRLGNGVGMAGKEPGHFPWTFEMPLGIGGEAETGFFQRHMLADAGDHIEHQASIRLVIAHIIAGDHGSAVPAGECGNAVEPGAVLPVEAGHSGHPDPPGRLAPQMIKGLFGSAPIRLIRHEDEELALRKILRRALELRRSRIARAEQIIE